jgi:hypothetical protein
MHVVLGVAREVHEIATAAFFDVGARDIGGAPSRWLEQAHHLATRRTLIEVDLGIDDVTRRRAGDEYGTALGAMLYVTDALPTRCDGRDGEPETDGMASFWHRVLRTLYGKGCAGCPRWK